VEVEVGTGLVTRDCRKAGKWEAPFGVSLLCAVREGAAWSDLAREMAARPNGPYFNGKGAGKGGPHLLTVCCLKQEKIPAPV